MALSTHMDFDPLPVFLFGSESDPKDTAHHRGVDSTIHFSYNISFKNNVFLVTIIVLGQLIASMFTNVNLCQCQCCVQNLFQLPEESAKGFFYDPWHTRKRNV